MPGIVTGMIMAFTLSIDDFVISYFTSGTTQTLPIYIYSMTRKRISPEINALSTVLFVCIMLLLIIINVRQGREERRAKKAERERACEKEIFCRLFCCFWCSAPQSCPSLPMKPTTGVFPKNTPPQSPPV